MWGNILTEVTYQTNFNINFSNTKSDILIHLAQWQYWWWFWFSFFWVMYYLFTARILRYRTLKFRPKIVSSFRPHGKWGDLIICVIPVSWCMNILINSSFLMKLIEWQNESSLFTVRIRGKQWYWVYRFDLKNFTDILSTPKNVGRNNWQVSVFNELQTSNDYLSIIQLRAQNKWIKGYWNDIISKYNKSNKANIVSPQERFKVDLDKNFSKENFLNKANSVNINFHKMTTLETNNLHFKNVSNNINELNSLIYSNKKMLASSEEKGSLLLNSYNNVLESFNTNDLSFNNQPKFNKTRFNRVFKSLESNFLTNDFNNSLNNLTYIDGWENTRWIKRSTGKNSPLRLVKYPISNFKNLDTNGNLFFLRFDLEDSKLKHKIASDVTYLTLKQKRYKRRKSMPLIKGVVNNELGKSSFSGKLVLKNNSKLEVNPLDGDIQYRMVKKNKTRNENMGVLFSKRLLRVKRTLVLPAHVNITAITNSYDVCHSWFIPGLGLKLDCVPGRATHHTFYVDNVGFYYGQCAEICGRYHHHMPIRVCALPFEHFLVWWHSFGLPKLLFLKKDKQFLNDYAFRKFVW